MPQRILKQRHVPKIVIAVTALLLMSFFFFEPAWRWLPHWTSRVSIFFIFSCFYLLIFYLAEWVVMRWGRRFFGLSLSLGRSLKRGLATNPDVQKILGKYPRLTKFAAARLNRYAFTGLPLTLLALALWYGLDLLFGVTRGVLTSSATVMADERLGELLYVFRNASVAYFFLWVTLLGESVVVLMLAAATGLILWLKGCKKYVAPLTIAMAGTVAFIMLGKEIFHRDRPPVPLPVYHEASFSFPSSHAALSVAMYGFLMLLALRFVRRWPVKINITFGLLLVILLIGFSRIYLGLHYWSDVWSGALMGFVWLLIGFSATELIPRWRDVLIQHRRLTPGRRLAAAVAAAAVIMIYFDLALFRQPEINVANTVSATEMPVPDGDILALFEQRHLPKFSETLSGNPQEPFSFLVVAPDDASLRAAFKKAGWFTADEVSPNALLNIIRAFIEKENYVTAPMTPTFWDANVNEFGFEKPTESRSVSQRHHARFWRTGLKMPNGEAVYGGTASLDIGIKWAVTHRIDPAVDREREFLLTELIKTNLVASYRKESFVGPTLGRNFTRDQFFTDGAVYIVELEQADSI